MKKPFTILVVILSFIGLQSAYAQDVITLGISDQMATILNAYTGSASDVTVIVPAGYTNPEYTAATPLPISLISIPAVIKNLTIQGDGSNPTVLTTTFNLPATSLTSFTLKNLTIKGVEDGTTPLTLGNYVIGGSSAEAVATVNITGCSIANFRGIVRMRTGVNFTNINVDNCIIRNIGSYCLLVNEAGSTLGNYIIKNSTVYGTNTSLFGVSASLPTTFTISDCTFDNIIFTAGKYFIDFGTTTTTTALTISNTIIGKTANAATVKGIRGGTGFTYTVNNSYITSDCLTASPALTGFTAYANTAASLFTTPTTFDGTAATATVGNYSIKDNSFAAIAGDPRWRISTAVSFPKASSTVILYNGSEISLNEAQDIAIYGVTGQLLQSAKQVNKLSVATLTRGIYAAKAGMSILKFIVR